MKSVILHVGMHKTGTTSLQNGLRGLAAGGARYVELGSANHSIPMLAAFGEPSDAAVARIVNIRDARQLAKLRRKTRLALDQQLSAPGFDRFVISGEGMAFMSRSALADLRETLLRHVQRVQVCAYFRDPVGFSASAFQEHVKSGHAQFKVARPQYRAKFEKFLDVFGPENFAPRVFDRDNLRDGSVVADFCHQWAIPLDPVQQAVRNESLSESAVKLLHLFNRVHPLSHGRPLSRWAWPRMVEAIAERFPGKFTLPPQFHAEAIDPKDVAWLREQFGIDFTRPAPIGPEAEPRGFRHYLETIDAEVVASYQEMLEQAGVRQLPGRSLADLLECHYRACERLPAVRWNGMKARLARYVLTT